MGKLDLKLMQGIEETEGQIQKDRRKHGPASGREETEKETAHVAAGKSADRKTRKQVFSFRALDSDILLWKAYATAAGKIMESIGAAAMQEYLETHRLAGAEKAVFEAIKLKNSQRIPLPDEEDYRK